MANERPEERGGFAADIADDAIAAALRSVERIAGERATAEEADPAGESVAVDPAAAEAVDVAVVEPIPVEPAVPAVSAEELAARVAALEAELSEKDRFLEESMRRGRETMERLQEARERLEEANDRVLRSAADLENYRKRAQKEKDEIRRFGIENLLKDLLPVLDNFDRAIDAAPSCTDVPSFAAGVEMTRKLFEDTLGRFGVKSFRALGATFDPHLHEAVQGIESHEHPANVIVQEIVRGFFLHDRLVRPSMVVVSRGPGPAPAAAEPPAPAEREAPPVRETTGGGEDCGEGPAN